MKTGFYNRTPYRSADLDVPDCFRRLDECYDRYTTGIVPAWERYHLVHAENTCRRMGDIDLYAHMIKGALAHEAPMWGAILGGTFMVGYFSSCKSLFDAVAIALSEILGLSLARKEQDFAKGKFWRALGSASPALEARYGSYRGLFSDVVKWRDSAVHRITPILLAHSPGPPEKTPRDKVEIRMVARPDATFREIIVEKPMDRDWIEPLKLHHQWRPPFLNLCEALCLDIQDAVRSRGDK